MTRLFPLWQVLCRFCFHDIKNNTENICFTDEDTKARDVQHFIQLAIAIISKLEGDEQTHTLTKNTDKQTHLYKDTDKQTHMYI